MNKKEFLNQLRNRLQALPKNDIDDRISFYEEAIDDRIAEGKSEEEAVADVGTIDDIVEEIAKDTPLVKLVKERVKPKRSLRAWEIVLIILGFPLWFPLLTIAFVLCLVGYLLVWVLVLVTYTVETALAVSSLGCLVGFFAYMASGEFNLVSVGGAVMCLGAAMLWVFACIGATKVTIKLSKKIISNIKTSIIRKGSKE